MTQTQVTYSQESGPAQPAGGPLPGSLEGWQAGLALCAARLEAMPSTATALTQRTPGRMAFATGGAAAGPETISYGYAIPTGSTGLEQRLQALEAEALELTAYAAQAERPAASFGVLEDLSEKWAQANQQLQDFLEQLNEAVRNFAWVETQDAGGAAAQIAAQTRVAWSGDVETAWQKPDRFELAQQHQAAVHTALARRWLLMRTFAIVAAFAVKLSVLSAAPGGVILALPAAYKLVNQIQNELARSQQETQEAQNGN